MSATALMAGTARQRGAALVEFAFVMPVLVALLVAVIYYGYAFMLQAAVTYAAREGAQVAAAVNPLGLSTNAYQDAVETEVKQAVRNSLDWLPPAVEANLAEPEVTFPPGGNRVNVRVSLPTSGGGGGLLPRANLPLVGSVPPLPSTLVGVAEVAL